MLAIIGTLLSGVLSGGATGLLGVLLQRFFDMKHKQQEIEIVKLNLANSLELAKMENERAQIRATADENLATISSETQRAVAESDQEAREAEADSRSLIAALDSDKSSYLSPAAQLREGFWGGFTTVLMALVDFMRGVLRPLLTGYLAILTTYIFVWASGLVKESGGLTPDQLHQIVIQIITNILYVFTVCTLFWFGSRPPPQR